MDQDSKYINRVQGYTDTLHDVYVKALRLDPFEMLCTLLRVDATEDLDWELYEDSRKAFEEGQGLNNIRANDPLEKRGELTLYCHKVEMTAPHEMLANILRILAYKDYLVKPFGCLGRPKSGLSFSWVGPTTQEKFSELKRQAKAVGEVKLSECIDQFFDESLRSAISNSEYEFQDEFFNWTENGEKLQKPKDEVDETLYNGLAFYTAFLINHNHFKMMFREMPRLHKWPDYQVLEILSNENTGLYGFNIHFPNGTKAEFSHSEEGITSQNIFHNPDGSIQFNSGFHETEEEKWKINGEEILDWQEFSNAT
ncbi:MAG: hypothetical protein H8E32_08690 [Nitrospinae bacterium]|nr:hypothetical protein [Nitrospinota bacterium]